MNIKFNINNNVRVKLTPRGHEVNKRQHEELFLSIGKPELIEKYPYAPPVEDEDGWSEWQLWHLMKTFGSSCGCGSDLVMSTEIEFITE